VLAPFPREDHKKTTLAEFQLLVTKNQELSFYGKKTLLKSCLNWQLDAASKKLHQWFDHVDMIELIEEGQLRKHALTFLLKYRIEKKRKKEEDRYQTKIVPFTPY